MPGYNFEHNTQRDLERIRELDEYALRHLAVHLCEARRHDDLYRLLVGNKAWMQAKSERLGGDAAYVQDLEVASRDFKDPLTPQQIMALVQLHVARRVVMDLISNYTDDMLEVLVLLGREKEALSQVSLRDENDTLSKTAKVKGFMSIHDGLRKRGKVDLPLLIEAKEIASTIATEGNRAEALCKVAESMARTGFIDEALAVARGIDFDYSRVQALMAVTAAMVEVKDDRISQVLAEGLAIAQGDEKNQGNSLGAVAWAMAKAGYVDEAMSVKRDSALVPAAIAMAERGHVDEALTVVQGEDLDWGWGRLQALKGVAKALVERGLVDELLAVARKISDHSGWRPCALVAVAGALVSVKDSRLSEVITESLEATLSKWMRNEGRIDALVALATVMAKAGDSRLGEVLTRTLEAARGIKHIERRVPALMTVAKAMADVMDIRMSEVLTEGLETAHLEEGWEIGNAKHRIKALVRVAKTMAEMMDNRAGGVLEESIEMMRESGDTGGSGYVLAEVAKALVKRGDISNGVRVARGIGRDDGNLILEMRGEENWFRANALIGVVETAAKMGCIDESLMVARGFKDNKTRVSALECVAKAMARKGCIQDALDVLQELGHANDEVCRLETVVEVAQAMAEGGHMKEALDLTHTIPKKGQVVYARGIVRNVEYAYWRVSVLSKIVQVAPKTKNINVNDILRNILDLVGSISDDNFRIRASVDVAWAIAEGGRIERAMNVAQGIEWYKERAEALAHIARTMAKKGYIEEAISMARKIETHDEKAKTLAYVASLLVGIRAIYIGDILAEGIRAVLEMRPDFNQGFVLAQLARVAVASGHNREVIEAIQKIDSSGREYVLKEIASIMAKAGVFTEAFTFLPLGGSDDIIGILAEWSDAFENIEPGLALNILREAIRIAMWVYPNWQEVHALITRTWAGGRAGGRPGQGDAHENMRCITY